MVQAERGLLSTPVAFGPSLEGKQLAVDVLDGEPFGHLAAAAVAEQIFVTESVSPVALTVEPERSSFHATDDSTASSVADRFPLVWRVTAPVTEPVVLPSRSDGPFRAPTWLAEAVHRQPRPGAWPDWPVEVTVVGSFVNDDAGALEEARAALGAAESGSPPRLSVATTGAGLYQVRLRLRAGSPDELEEIAGTALASLDTAGALLHREDHRAFLSALYPTDPGSRP